MTPVRETINITGTTCKPSWVDESSAYILAISHVLRKAALVLPRSVTSIVHDIVRVKAGRACPAATRFKL